MCTFGLRAALAAFVLTVRTGEKRETTFVVIELLSFKAAP
jgi:hypothetical protein